jgi:superfamily II DNA helicase RecQ
MKMCLIGVNSCGDLFKNWPYDINLVLRLADQNANYEAKKVHLDNLYRMVQFCENKTDCRRSQQLTYFGEVFDRKNCGNMKQAICDNCSSKVYYITCYVYHIFFNMFTTSLAARLLHPMLWLLHHLSHFQFWHLTQLIKKINLNQVSFE